MPPLDPIKKTLIFIDLSSNNILSVPRNYFDGYRHLKRLNLSGNELSIAPNVQLLNRTLEVFLLNYNKITTLSGSVTEQEFKKLKELGLNSNLLTVFAVRFLSYWPSLRLLDISFTPLTTVPNTSGLNITRSQDIILALASDTIECDSGIAWLFGGLQGSETIGHSYRKDSIRTEGFMKSKCATPMTLSGRVVGQLSKENHIKLCSLSPRLYVVVFDPL